MELFGELLKGGTWKGEWQREGYVGGSVLIIMHGRSRMTVEGYVGRWDYHGTGQLAVGLAAGNEYVGDDSIRTVGQLDELLKSGSSYGGWKKEGNTGGGGRLGWKSLKGDWQPEYNVGGGSRIGRRSSLASWEKAGAGSGVGGGKGIHGEGIHWNGSAGRWGGSEKGRYVGGGSRLGRRRFLARC